MSNTTRGPRPTPPAQAKRLRVPEPIEPWLRRLGRLAQAQGLEAYAVGGCVRDWLLGAARATDLDVCVVGDGIAFAQAAARRLDARVVVHEPFGTATLERRPAGLRIDVAGCRKETYAKPAAYPTVSPGTLREDLFRRDFTINAMAMAIGPQAFGRLVDAFGGWRDVKARRLRVLHADSFVDDPSRILRAARFAVRYGLSLEPQTARWLQQALAAGLVARLNRGRIRKELVRMLEEPDPVACLAQVGRWLNGSRRLTR
ncbi:MAG: CCA tRNA nucleotidyltransferase [Candidatus Omnitrophica bacterium]|nr:CCA tRNA nucleotidyltransferase [Candidatus Omnitrophota bacterium]